jgi:3-oxoacyl-[acyl-carrier-protein] synthase-3
MHIVNVTYQLPETYETVMAMAKRVNLPLSEAKVFERVFGLKNLPIDLNATIEPLLIAAASCCLKEASIQPQQIKWLIHAHTATHVCPFGQSAVRSLKQKLGLDHAIAFGTGMTKCAAIFTAFEIANELLKSLAQDKYILLVTGDVAFTEVLQYIPGSTITTDGAAAILLAKDSINHQYLSSVNITYGEFAAGVWGEKANLQKFEKHYSQYLSAVILAAIAKANLSLEQIKLILPHNVNTLSWLKVIKELSLPRDTIFLDNIPRTAHCFGSDPFINLRDALMRNLIQKGDYYLLATVGLGATFAAMVFQY